MELSSLWTESTRQADLPFDEDEWAERIRGDSYAAFEALFDAYYAELVESASYYVHRKEVAEELVQDVFFNIWDRRHDWHPRGALRTYLYGAVRNHCLMHLRHEKVVQRWRREERHRPRPEADGPVDRLEYKEFSRAVQQAIEALPERRRLVFTLSRRQGLTYAEIAALLDLSINTVENQMVRALKTLRERLAHFLGEG